MVPVVGLIGAVVVAAIVAKVAKARGLVGGAVESVERALPPGRGGAS